MNILTEGGFVIRIRQKYQHLMNQIREDLGFLCQEKGYVFKSEYKNIDSLLQCFQAIQASVFIYKTNLYARIVLVSPFTLLNQIEFKNLLTLKLISLNIETIEPIVTLNAPILKEIDLSDNKIIYIDALSKLSVSLTTLSLSRNLIKDFEPLNSLDQLSSNLQIDMGWGDQNNREPQAISYRKLMKGVYFGTLDEQIIAKKFQFFQFERQMHEIRFKSRGQMNQEEHRSLSWEQIQQDQFV